LAHFTISASLGWVTNSCWDHQFWYLMAIVYNQISDHQRLNCNCQKHQKFCIWLFHLHLTYLISVFSILLHILVFSYLILVTYILSYLLVLDHLTLKLNKSHNILEKNQEAMTKLLHFVQLAGAKKSVALFE
jgi:hypothetical protein